MAIMTAKALGATLVAATLALAACSEKTDHSQLYGAIQMFGSHLTAEDADKLVETINSTVEKRTGGAVRLSDSEAEQIAIGFVRAKMEPALWQKAASFSVTMVQVKPSAFINTQLDLNIISAAEQLSHAYAEPSVAAETLSGFGLLNGTEYEEITNAAASGDEDKARKALNAALSQYD